MSAGAGEVHLLDYWSVLVRRRAVVYLGVVAVGLVALVGSFVTTPLYRGKVTLQIERQNPEVLGVRGLNAVDYSFAAYSDFYQTQYKILQSDAVLRKAATAVALLDRPGFADVRKPGLLSRLRALLPRTAPRVEVDPMDAAAGRIRGALEITPVRNSHLVQVGWVSPDPELAAGVANAVVDAYIAFNVESRFTASDQARAFLVEQIANLRQEVSGIEERLQRYGEAKQIVSIDGSNNITLAALNEIAAKRTEAETVLAGKEAGYRAALSTPDEALPEVSRSTLIARLKEEYAAYEADYSEKARRFHDEWPGMQTLRSKLDQAKERLAAETAAIAAATRLTAESEYRKALAEVKNLDALLERQAGAAQQLKRDAVEYANLQSEVQKKRESLNALLTRQNEMALSSRLKDMDASSTNVVVVDRARPPVAPFRPNRTLNTLLGLVLGLVLGVGAAFFLDYLDNTLASPQEVESIARLPNLAVVPRHGAAPEGRPRALRREPAAAPDVDLVADRDRNAAVSEAYRELRTSILLANAGKPPRRIMVTSALPEEGKSATAMNLAVVLAQLGRRVLLVDTDLRRPRLHRAFGIDNGRGISGVLSGLDPDPIAAIAATGIERLDLLPSGPVPPNPSELLNGPAFLEVTARFLEAGYDHILFDSPPVLAVADPIIIASTVDAAILVVRAGRTPRESLRAAGEKFKQAGIRLSGVVLNDLDVHLHGYRPYAAYGRYEHSGNDGEAAAGGA